MKAITSIKGSSVSINKKEMAKNGGPTEHIMKGASKQAWNMVKVRLSGATAINIQVGFNKINYMEKEGLFGAMEGNILANGFVITWMVKVSSNGLMADIIKAPYFYFK